MRIHIIGIGGAAAAYLVDLALHEGHVITGSDAVASNNTQAVEHKKIIVTIPHQAAVIGDGINEVWYSAAITSSSSGFAELERARSLRIPTLSFAEVGARYFNRARVRVAVAGTHGKSTTTAMVGWILEKAGMDPTVAIGATLHHWNGSARIGAGDIFVMEADEYARRFLNLQPTLSIINAIDTDHFDTYPSEDDLVHAFAQFADNTSDYVIANGSSLRVRRALSEFGGRVMYYGTQNDEHQNDVWIDHSEHDALIMPLHLPLKLTILGDHNLQNALAAITVCSRVGVAYAKGAAALADFPGIERRFEYIGQTKGGTPVYDDYGHHPVEIEATLIAARQEFPDRRIILIHEPHQAGRLVNLMSETAEALTHADELILLPVYAVHGREHEQDVREATSDRLAEVIKQKGGHVHLVHGYDDAAEEVQKMIVPKSVVITMGATDIGQVGRTLLQG